VEKRVMPNKPIIIKNLKKPTIHVVPIKVVEPIVKITTQLVKPTIVPLRYPCIIYSSSENCAFDCPRNT
jgi:hypothetical protein